MKELLKIFLVVIFLPAVVFSIEEEDLVDKSPATSASPEVEADGERNALSGSIDLDLEKKKVNRYGSTQDFVIGAFEETQARINKLLLKEDAQDGEFSKKKFVFSDGDLLYFASAYLYCVSKKGACPYMLDALLEIDFLALCNDVNGVCQRPKKVACANMTRMWKTWIDNDLEQRLSHSIPIGLMGKYNDFKQNNFSQYLKCSRTLLPRIKDALKDKNYLNKFYSDKKVSEDFSKTIQYLIALKDNVTNIMAFQGIE